MPPATPDNASTRLNGMQFSGNVGVDAHIDPKPYGTILYVEWDGAN